VNAINRRLRDTAAETIAIVARGGYRSPAGVWVDIADIVSSAVVGTRLHLPDEPLTGTGPPNPNPIVDVTTESTLTAARQLGDGTAALVFASARNPGGGFRTGAQAQEEDIARASALHACLDNVPAFYIHHRGDADLRYSDRVIYAPQVPVFRDDTGRLLVRPHQTAMLVAAAPNLRAVQRNQPDHAATVPTVLAQRAARILTVAAAYGHRRLILGAWGCGVFGNVPHVVAEAFATALNRIDRFDHVVFAVLDRAPATPTYRTFAQILASTRSPNGLNHHL
jgi:uncharacterized protein (TIGR02452 family)